MIIIPDIHGRRFWQQPTLDYFGKEPILFLGDYLDPYPEAFVTPAAAFSNLEQLVSLKEAHPENITLLLGNHDIHYLTPLGRGSRFDLAGGARNRLFFQKHAEAFQLTCEVTAGRRHYLFSHAGILAGWLNQWQDFLGGASPRTIGRQLNTLWENRTNWPGLFLALADVSSARGGTARYGSPVWADEEEFCTDAPELPGVYQIFGHTRCETPVIGPYFACLDCGKAFRLDEESGIIRPLDKNKPL